MAQNFPGPMEIEWRYTVTNIEHKLRLSFDVPNIAAIVPGMDIADIQPVVRTGANASTTLVPYVNSLLADLQPFFNASDASGGVLDVWLYTLGTYDRTWITSYTPPWTPNSAVDTGLASQTTMTFRSGNGGIMKLVLLETAGNSNAQISPSNYDSVLTAVADNFTDADSIWIARDNGYAIGNIRLSPGQNEATWRKRYR